MCRKRKMNMRVTKAEVIKTASDMADRNGLHNVSLKAIAENLGIRTPSLYNHIGSLDELLREIAHSGMRTMNEKMIRAVIGKTGDSALKLVAVEYLNYMIEHPGVYEIIQWASWNGTEETAIIFNDTATTEIYTLSLHDALPILKHLFAHVALIQIRPLKF